MCISESARLGSCRRGAVCVWRLVFCSRLVGSMVGSRKLSVEVGPSPGNSRSRCPVFVPLCSSCCLVEGNCSALGEITEGDKAVQWRGHSVCNRFLGRPFLVHLRFAFTHQKIPAPAAPKEPSPVPRAVRVQAANCLSQLARPRKTGKSQCVAATAHTPAVARAPTLLHPPPNPHKSSLIKIKNNKIGLRYREMWSILDFAAWPDK